MLVLVIWPLYPSYWIFDCPDWLIPHEAPGFEDKSELPLLAPPPKNRAETSCGLAIRPLDKDYYLNQKIPPRIFSVFSSSPKGINDSNGLTA